MPDVPDLDTQFFADGKKNFNVKELAHEQADMDRTQAKVLVRTAQDTCRAASSRTLEALL